MPNNLVQKIREGLAFQYAYAAATEAPGKQTATQRKGRIKDAEAAENTPEPVVKERLWREATFVGSQPSGKDYGNAIHSVMQYIDYSACSDEAGVSQEIQRLVAQQYITQEQAQWIRPGKIASFFASSVGSKLRNGNVVREFKFSILEDGALYDPALAGEQVLLQGVVDCALIEDDGITVIDFKTDYVTEETLPAVVERYRPQVEAYASAMHRIYEMPVKARMLYFFRLDRFVQL
jgi:ATP-dependent helicase/nuclease subunit A